MYRRISNLYPETKLFSFPMEKKGKTISYGLEIENQMSSFVEKEITKYVLKDKIFAAKRKLQLWSKPGGKNSADNW